MVGTIEIFMTNMFNEICSYTAAPVACNRPIHCCKQPLLAKVFIHCALGTSNGLRAISFNIHSITWQALYIIAVTVTALAFIVIGQSCSVLFVSSTPTHRTIFIEISLLACNVWRSWLIGIESGLGTLHLGYISARVFKFDYVITEQFTCALPIKLSYPSLCTSNLSGGGG